MPADSERNDEGLSRRQVIARCAVAAGVVWAAPVIRSATAYATSSSGTERPCIKFFLVAIDALGVRPVRFAPDSKLGYDDIPEDVLAAMAASTTTTTSTPSTSTTSTTTTTTTTKPAAPKASKQAPPTTTSSTTTTTRAPLPDRGTDESASQFVAESTTTTTRPPATSRGSKGSSTPRRPSTAPATGSTVDDFGLFADPAAVAPVAPATAVDPRTTLVAAATAAAQAGTPDSLPPGIRDWLEQNPDVPVQYPTEPPMLTQTGDAAWAVLLTPVDGPDPLTHQCRGVKGWAQSKGKNAEFFVDPNPVISDEAGRRLIFPNPRVDDLATDPSALIDHVVFVFCCPQ